MIELVIHIASPPERANIIGIKEDICSRLEDMGDVLVVGVHQIEPEQIIMEQMKK